MQTGPTPTRPNPSPGNVAHPLPRAQDLVTTPDPQMDQLAHTGRLGRLSAYGQPMNTRPARGRASRSSAALLPRRLALAASAIAVTMTGLLVHYRASGDFASLVADALYAVLVYLLFAMIAPGARRGFILVLSVMACTAIEFFQVTGVPQAMAEAVPAVSLLLGTTFAFLDLVAYAVGVAAVALVDAVAGWMWRPRPTRK
ncbi:MAG: hypothetical protein JWQ43_3688 [Glaciihabitans sp.]|nr:hypothetical protein [Glaciihabitans sp.]